MVVVTSTVSLLEHFVNRICSCAVDDFELDRQLKTKIEAVN